MQLEILGCIAVAGLESKEIVNHTGSLNGKTKSSLSNFAVLIGYMVHSEMNANSLLLVLYLTMKVPFILI